MTHRPLTLCFKDPKPGKWSLSLWWDVLIGTQELGPGTQRRHTCSLVNWLLECSWGEEHLRRRAQDRAPLTESEERAGPEGRPAGRWVTDAGPHEHSLSFLWRLGPRKEPWGWGLSRHARGQWVFPMQSYKEEAGFSMECIWVLFLDHPWSQHEGGDIWAHFLKLPKLCVFLFKSDFTEGTSLHGTTIWEILRAASWLKRSISGPSKECNYAYLCKSYANHLVNKVCKG